MTEQHENYPNGLEALCLVAILFFVEILIAATIGQASLFAQVNIADFGGLITVAGNGVLFCGLMAYKRMRYSSLFHPARHSVASTLSTLSIPVLMLVPGLLLGIGMLNVLLVALFPMTSAEREMFEEIGTGGIVGAFFSCVAAPVLEEMLFRGVILRSFLRQYSRRAAILGSSALFGLVHLNVYQLAAGFLIGLIAGWLYERARSLWPCIVLHAGYNSAVTYYAATYVERAGDEPSFAAPLAALGCTALGALALRWLFATGDRNGRIENRESQS
jgi:uncharacterized protein